MTQHDPAAMKVAERIIERLSDSLTNTFQFDCPPGILREWQRSFSAIITEEMAAERDKLLGQLEVYAVGERQAIDESTALRTRNAVLREALEEIRDKDDNSRHACQGRGEIAPIAEAALAHDDTQEQHNKEE